MYTSPSVATPGRRALGPLTFRSRCTTLFRCRKATPLRICLASRITSFSVKASSLSATHWSKISPPAALQGEEGGREGEERRVKLRRTEGRLR